MSIIQGRPKPALPPLPTTNVYPTALVGLSSVTLHLPKPTSGNQTSSERHCTGKHLGLSPDMSLGARFTHQGQHLLPAKNMEAASLMRISSARREISAAYGYQASSTEPEQWQSRTQKLPAKGLGR